MTGYGSPRSGIKPGMRSRAPTPPTASSVDSCFLFVPHAIMKRKDYVRVQLSFIKIWHSDFSFYFFLKQFVHFYFMYNRVSPACMFM